MKKKILVLSDHALSTSGVGTQTRHLIGGLLKKERYTFRQLGAALKHNDYRTIIVNDDFIINFLDKNKHIPLIIFSKKGYLFEKLQKLRSENKINIFTQSDRLNKITHFLNNVDCFLLRKFNTINIDTFIKKNIKKNKKLIFKKSNNAFLIYVNFPRKNSRPNTITLVSKDDF